MGVSECRRAQVLSSRHVDARGDAIRRVDACASSNSRRRRRGRRPRRLSPRVDASRVADVRFHRARARRDVRARAKTRASPRSALECATNDDLGVRSIVSARPFGDDDAKNAAFEASTSDAQFRGITCDALAAPPCPLPKISYDGGRYRGFQYQGEDVPTIQRELERALVKMTGKSREELRLLSLGGRTRRAREDRWRTFTSTRRSGTICVDVKRR